MAGLPSFRLVNQIPHPVYWIDDLIIPQLMRPAAELCQAALDATD